MPSARPSKLRVGTDEEGVAVVENATAVAARHSGVLAVPGSRPCCERCWGEPAAAYDPADGAAGTFLCSACAARPGRFLVPVVSEDPAHHPSAADPQPASAADREATSSSAIDQRREKEQRLGDQ